MSGLISALHYPLAFALMLGVLVFVHELGHFLVAHLSGVKVIRFSVGFGRPLYSLRFGRDATEWSVGVFPLGGYVKMLDEGEGTVAPEELHRSFNRQSVWRRMAIVAAGPFANVVLAIVVYWGLFYFGVEELKPVLGVPAVSSPAETAGIVNGERVLKIAGKEVQTWQEMRWFLLDLAVDQDVVELEVMNRANEINIHHLEVSVARKNGWQDDFLKKLGITFYRPPMPAIVGEINARGPAAAVGLAPGDKLLRIDSEVINVWSDVARIIRNSPGQSVQIEFERQGQRNLVAVTPDSVEDGSYVIGRIGVAVRDSGHLRDDLTTEVRYGAVDALSKAVRETWSKSIFSLVMIGKMLIGEVSLRNVSGPLTIADYAGQSAKLGLDKYLGFLALVSVSLAVLNLLPVPVLDGGYLLYYVAEIIRGKPLPDSSMKLLQRIGMSIMLMLMVLAFYNDFNRLILG